MRTLLLIMSSKAVIVDVFVVDAIVVDAVLLLLLNVVSFGIESSRYCIHRSAHARKHLLRGREKGERLENGSTRTLTEEEEEEAGYS